MPVTGMQPVLTLENVLDGVKRFHPKLFGADLERRIAAAKNLEKQGAFDPNLSMESDYLRYNDFSKKGKVSQTWDNDAAVNWLSRSGVKLAVGGRYNTGSVKPPLYPTGETGEYFMSAKVPLLRGFRINEKSVAQSQAAIGMPLADNAYFQQELNLLQQAAIAYWDWVTVYRKWQVQQQLITLAADRLTAIKARVKVGDLPVIDEVEATQEVVRRDSQMTKAKRDCEKSTYKLSRYLWDSVNQPAPLPVPKQIPPQLPSQSDLSDDTWMDARQSAVDKRPEVRAFPLQRQLSQIDLNYAKNLRKPILDIYATPGWDTGHNSIGPTLKAGVSLVVPLRQRTADGLILAATYKLNKLDVEQRWLLQQVLLDVDDAVSAIRAAYAQIQLMKRELRLAEKLEAGEREKFAYGDSNLFMVNQRERASAEVRQKLLDLENEYYQSQAFLTAASGGWTI